MHSTGGFTNFRDRSLNDAEASLDEGISVHCTGRLSKYEGSFTERYKIVEFGRGILSAFVQIRRLITER